MIQRLLQSRSFLRSIARNSHSIAIVGSGPSGCYTAKYLLQQLPEARIDILDRLPTPYGLVRYGVAPDHPEVKNVQSDFDTLFLRARFLGHVDVGTNDVSVKALRENYDAVVLAYGCQADRTLSHLGTPPKGVLSAREFVAWYNGHPNFEHIGSVVKDALSLADSPSVVVLGQGNVALDCARILVKGTAGLFDTDVAQHALDVIGDGVPNVSIVGRRGHVQGAFTIKELRELVKLEAEGYQVGFRVRSEELALTPASEQELEASRPRQRMHKLLMESADRTSEQPKYVHLRFFLNPSSWQGSDHLEGVVLEHTRLEGESGTQSAVGTSEFEVLPAQLALVSIGYKGVALPGTDSWFDESRGTFRHAHGCVDPASEALGGLYTAGWVKRGPSGIIGTNIPDAKDTVATILKDLQSSEPKLRPFDLEEELKKNQVDYVTWEGYRKIEHAERERRRSEKQPREKIVSLQEQLHVANS